MFRYLGTRPRGWSLGSIHFARFVESLLYGVTTTDPLSIGAAVLILGLAALRE
jgi:hypothetical protein